MADEQDRRVALLALHQRHADAILVGTKTVELRRQAPATDLSHIALYATSPIALVIGWAEVETIVQSSPSAVWNTWGPHTGVTRAAFRSYFRGAEFATAIVLGTAQRLSKPLLLADLGITRPPQNFMYLNGNASAVIPALAY